MINAPGTISKQVMQFYSYTSFPTDDLCGETAPWPGTAVPTTPPDPMDDVTEVLAHTVAGVPICHASISKWCYAAGVNLAMADSLSRGYKNDRCGKVCAEIAAYTAKLINGATANGASFTSDPVYQAIVPGYTLPDSVQDCRGCHHKKMDVNIAPAQIGEMQCDGCHTDFMPHQGKKFLFEKLWTEGWDSVLGWVPQNTFAPNAWIRYCMRFQVLAPGALFVRMKPMTSGAEGYDSGSGVWKQGYFNRSADCSGNTDWYFPSSGGIQLPPTAITKGRFKAQVQVGDSAVGPMIFESPLKMVYFDVNP
jgi:hypothetical protein